MKGFFAFLGILVGILGLTWLIQGNEFFLYKYFGPKTEQVRRQIFEQSKAYNQGMVQELENMQFEYIKASPDHKLALASIILHRSADFDLNDNRVPLDLRIFIEGLRKEVK